MSERGATPAGSEGRGGWLEPVQLEEASLTRFEQLLGPDGWRRFTEAGERAGRLLAGRRVWNLNSSDRGGGVAELLDALLPIARASGVDTRWLVLRASPQFFSFTKDLHNLLHASPTVSSPGIEDGRPGYEGELGGAAAQLHSFLKTGDVVIVHDPQPAGLLPAIKELGAHAVWRSHIGTDEPSPAARTAWAFLMPYVSLADATVFTRPTYIWSDLEPDGTFVIAPSIDPFAPKNQDLETGAARAILSVIGLTTPSEAADAGQPRFTRPDGSLGIVRRQAELTQEIELPAGAPMVLQVSRWDRLKDPVGVLEGFSAHVSESLGAHLVLAGPSAVSDDPQGLAVLKEVTDAWRRQSPSTRRRLHILTLPMDDEDENAAMVNALQRRSTVVVQKSLEEGFGLTVAEAMWKGRPVVASRRGGIQDQIEDGVSGLLLDDPLDLPAFGRRLEELLRDPDRAARLGAAARLRVEREFLAPRELEQWVDVLERVLA